MNAQAAKTKPVRVRGLLLEPPDGGDPREVYVNDDNDWEVFYRNPKAKVACLDPDCPGLLTAKQMSKSGLRYFARKSGSCSHFLTDLPIEQGETEIDPTARGAGGGPEGAEHLWVKGRLYTIAKKCLDEDPVVEESTTHADVLLAKSGLVLEYQRWDTDFNGRSMARLEAGASKTIWLVPDENNGKRAFQSAVNDGAMYLNVVDRNDPQLHLKPWERHEQNKHAVLRVSGSIVSYDSNLGRLVRRSRPLDVVLREIIAGDRVCLRERVYNKKKGRTATISAWVLKSDLARWHEEQRRQRTASAVTNVRKTPPEAGSTSAPMLEASSTSPEAPGNAQTTEASSSPGVPLNAEPRQETELALLRHEDNPRLTPTTSGEKANPWPNSVPTPPPETLKPAAPSPRSVTAESTEPRKLKDPSRRNIWDRVVDWFQGL
ncbi:hypothetical protein [Dermabacter hominis]|uniref:hypothetical protein n=1 Tax=Dermabacter hominis TaxID=36740 RepID=UPI00223B5B4A|nr:hypothetical protein [Dermabacter hominis]MCT2024474.1 hypothetical protein [Dermabacter hominis]